MSRSKAGPPLPIIDVQIVLAKDEAVLEGLCQQLADRLGQVLGVGPGHLWLRLQVLPASNYAENEATVAASDLPVFVTVMHAKPPEGEERQGQAVALARCVAAVVGREQTQVHIEYAPSGAGRIAIGGNLVQ